MSKVILRSLIAAAALAALPINASADDAALVCPGLGQMAENIMKFRQRGIPMSKQMEIVNASPSAQIRDMGKLMVVSAYKERQAYSDDAKAGIIQRFRNDSELQCYEVWGKKATAHSD